MAQTELRFSVRGFAAHFFICEVAMDGLFFIMLLVFALVDAEVNNPRPEKRPDKDDPRRTIEDDISEFLETVWTKIKNRIKVTSKNSLPVQ